MKRAPTIRDVAKACGLSHMTVSNVMNNRPVSEATRKQVLEAMRELNYQPSAIARGLNRKPMDTLGVVLPHSDQSPVSHPYYGPTLDGIMSAAISLHRDVTIYTGSLWTGDMEGLRRYRDGRTDGLLLVSPIAQPSLVRALVEARVPLICIGAYPNEPDVRCVTIDDAKGGLKLLEHLKDLGHRRISYVSLHEAASFIGPRRRGYEKAMETLALPFNESSFWYGGMSQVRVKQQVEAYVAMPPAKRPTAFYCFNDETALTLVGEFRAAGLRVPEDVSVVGFDDVPAAEKMGLTTARQPMRDIGAQAAKLLVDLLTSQADGNQEDWAGEPQTVYFDAEFILRKTTAPPPSA